MGNGIVGISDRNMRPRVLGNRLEDGPGGPDNYGDDLGLQEKRCCDRGFYRIDSVTVEQVLSAED